MVWYLPIADSLSVPRRRCVRVLPLGRPRLSRGGQLAECCGDDVDAASQPAGRKFAGGYEAVSGCATDSQQLRGTGHRQQQREFAKDIVLQFNSPPSRMDMNDAFVALAGCIGGRTWLLRHRDRDVARSFVFAFAASRDWRAGVRRLGEKVQDNVVVGDPNLTQLPSRALSNSCLRCGQR